MSTHPDHDKPPTRDRGHSTGVVSVPAATLVGIDGRRLSVEVHVADGLPSFTVIGAPNASCRELRDRVRAAVLSSGLLWPQRRVTVNIAPSGVANRDAVLDLAVGVGVLAATGQIPTEVVTDRGFVGELGLDGSIRPTRGALPMIEALVDVTEVVVPAGSQPEACLVPGEDRVRAVADLATLVAVLRGERPWPTTTSGDINPQPRPSRTGGEGSQRSGWPRNTGPGLVDLPGLDYARYGLEVAAAGAHPLLLVGPAGSATSGLVRHVVDLLPDLDTDQALEVARIFSAAGLGVGREPLERRPPLRLPHPGVSLVSLLGRGTSRCRPGEFSLAHLGVLVLDEVTEFAPALLDSLTGPLDTGSVRVARGSDTALLPARFVLVATMTPCPCGAPASQCYCTQTARARYARRLPGSLQARFDLRITIDHDLATNKIGNDTSELDRATTDTCGSLSAAAARVAEARGRARKRGAAANAELAPEQLKLEVPLTPEADRVIDHVVTAGHLTGRGVHAIQRVALTVADIEGDRPPLTSDHIRTALRLRSIPRPPSR